MKHLDGRIRRRYPTGFRRWRHIWLTYFRCFSYLRHDTSVRYFQKMWELRPESGMSMTISHGTLSDMQRNATILSGRIRRRLQSLCGKLRGAKIHIAAPFQLYTCTLNQDMYGAEQTAINGDLHSESHVWGVPGKLRTLKSVL